MITLAMDALLTDAPPIRIAATAGIAIQKGPMYSCTKPKPCSYTRMPTAPSHVDITTEIRRILSTLMPAALANAGLEPTAVMAVPVLVCRNAHIRNASNAKNSRLPVGITRLIPSASLRSIWRKLANALS